jgi:hypothetical protein
MSPLPRFRRTQVPRRRAPAIRTPPSWRLLALEDRLSPANFNIANGDIAGFRAAILQCNVNNQADTVNLAANGTYTFTDLAANETLNGLPTILRDTSLANTVTINGNGATLVRSSGFATPNLRFLQVGVFPNDVSVIINNVNFANGNAGNTADGGAILLLAGDLTISGGTFSNNQPATAAPSSPIPPASTRGCSPSPTPPSPATPRSTATAGPSAPSAPRL